MPSVSLLVAILIGITALAAGAGFCYFVFRYTSMGLLKKAEQEAEIIKKNKIVEAKEKFIALKLEHDNQLRQDEQRKQQREQQLQQREQQLNSRQGELQRAQNELNQRGQQLEQQQKAIDFKRQEIERLHKQAEQQLEKVSGISAEEAKMQLVEALKDEAKTNAMAYINDIMEDARLTANKEAKKIVIRTIQRVASETTAENAVSVFHIDNDEVKGRVIGREGRNIRALEAATGVEIIVDDTPEAPSNPSGKLSTIEYDYVFDHWSPAIEPVSATGPKVYTAVYRQEPRKYTISFYDETGEIKIGEQILAYGETPVAPEVTKKEPEPGRRYTYVWQNMDDASKNIETVTGNANYKPVFDGEPMVFSITLKSNPSGACTFTGAGSYKYNEEVEISLNVKDEDYRFTGWSDGVATATRTMVVTKDTVLVANFNYEAGVTINWKNEDGSKDLVDPVKQKVGASTTYLGEIPTKEADAEFTYTFYGWSTAPNGEGDKYKNGMTPKAADGGATYYAYFTKTLNQYTVTLRNAIPGACEFRGSGVRDYGTTVNIVATPNGDYEFVKWQETGSTVADFNLVVTGDITLTAIVKEKEKPAPGDLELDMNATETVSPATNYTDVVITSNGISASSQIINANNITLYGNADFVLSKDFAKRTWYCVAVPWRVEANGGIYIGDSSTPAVLGTDIDICYYDGAVRAAQGKVSACWVYLKNQGAAQQILQPGRAYMIALLKTPANALTFRKKALEPILTTGTSVQQYNATTGEVTDGGWNAIANPALFHAYVNAGSTDAKAQRYNSAEDSYKWFDLDKHKLVVGEPIYVQAPAAKSIVVDNTAADYNAAAAPVRRAKAQTTATRFDVEITPAGATAYADHLSITLNEDKEEDRYIIGQDLVKFGVSGKVAQMWIDRYDAKLCVNAVAPEDDATSFPMSLFAPKAGVYTIAIDREVATEDYNLYLTYNGQAIWNLSDGAYTLNLNKGTDANYGLRISLKAPQVTTGVDEAIVDAQGETRKVLINNQVFIIRGNKVYSMDGQLVK